MTTRLPERRSSARIGRILRIPIGAGMALLIVGALLLRPWAASHAETAPTPPRVIPENAGSPLKVETPAPFVSLSIKQDVVMTFAYVPAGSFMMGSPKGEANRIGDETLHRVTITRPFYISQTEVTGNQCLRVSGWAGEAYSSGGRPAGFMAPAEVQEFCRKLSAIAGCTVRIPTEAEWEYACRAGTATACHWGEDVAALGPPAWSGGRMMPAPVAQFPLNAWGLYDMHGNMAELCSDTYAPYPEAPEPDPQHVQLGGAPIYRGGSYAAPWPFCRSAQRQEVGKSGDEWGARVVMEVTDAHGPALAPIPPPPRNEAEALDRLQKHLDGGGSPNVAVGPYRTWLELAAVNNYLKLAEAFLSKNALPQAHAFDPQKTDGRGPWTPLHSAALRGHLAMARLLLEKGAVLDAVDGLGRTPLTYALEAGHADLARFLIEKNANCRATNRSRTSVLYFAMMAAKPDLVKAVLDKGAEADLKGYDAMHRTPLGVAMGVAAATRDADVRRECEKSMVVLIERGARPLESYSSSKHDPAELDARTNETMIHRAAAMGMKDLVRACLDVGYPVELHTHEGVTPLHCALRSGNVELVQMLLDRGATLAGQSRGERSILHLAAATAGRDVLELLLKKGAAMEDVDFQGYTPLYSAAEAGNAEAVRFLIEKGAALTVKTRSDVSLLHLAAERGDRKLLEYLLGKGQSVRAKDDSARTPLHYAAQAGNLEGVKFLLEKGARALAIDAGSRTALTLAAGHGHARIVALLAPLGGDPNVSDEEYRSPLYDMVKLGDLEAAKALIAAGARVEPFMDRDVPLLEAVIRDDVDLVKLLISSGAKPDVKRWDRQTPLVTACEKGLNDIAKLLIAAGADVNMAGHVSSETVSPLHQAASTASAEVVQRLIDKGAVIQAKDRNGRTPLHWAARGGNAAAVEVLVKKGADVNVTSEDGETPLHLVAGFAYVDHRVSSDARLAVIRALLDAGADAGIRDPGGKTARDLAEKKHADDIVRLLDEKERSSTTAPLPRTDTGKTAGE